MSSSYPIEFRRMAGIRVSKPIPLDIDYRKPPEERLAEALQAGGQTQKSLEDKRLGNALAEYLALVREETEQALAAGTEQVKQYAAVLRPGFDDTDQTVAGLLDIRKVFNLEPPTPSTVIALCAQKHKEMEPYAMYDRWGGHRKWLAYDFEVGESTIRRSTGPCRMAVNLSGVRDIPELKILSPGDCFPLYANRGILGLYPKNYEMPDVLKTPEKLLEELPEEVRNAFLLRMFGVILGQFPGGDEGSFLGEGENAFPLERFLQEFELPPEVLRKLVERFRKES